ncbi:MAG: nucleotidyltransferase family protein [Elusimicrobiota bacterium]
MNNITSLYGIILSAGPGSRLKGAVKALLKTGGKTFIEKIISAMRKCGVGNIIVVLGYKAGTVTRYLKRNKSSRGVRVLINKNYSAQQAATGSQQIDSLRIAVRTLPAECSGIIFTPVDHPLTKLSTYKKLINGWLKDKEKICVPSWNYRKGHPTIFPRKIFEMLLRKNVRGGARYFIKKYGKEVNFIRVNDKNIIVDFDGPEDLPRRFTR